MKTIHINNDDNYATPPAIYDRLDSIFSFDFDPCPYCEDGIVVDGLSIEWGERNYINPPYSDLKESGYLKSSFVKKAITESKKGKLCVMLLPVSTSTKLFHNHILPHVDMIEYVFKRIKFGKIDENGKFYLPLNSKGKTQTGTKDSMIVIFDGRDEPLNYRRNYIRNAIRSINK